MAIDPAKLTGGDNTLAQSIYLANMYAQRGECQCIACQLLRQSTDGMIKQMLGGGDPSSQLELAKLVKQMGGGDPSVDPTAQEVSQ